MEELLKYWPVAMLFGGLAVAWGDLRRTMWSHQQTTKNGFQGVNSRLDKQNGRIDKAEARLSEQGERIARLEP